MIEYVGIGVLYALGLAYGYFHGPGWLYHLECPYCCWCNTRVPLGDRIEQRLAARFREVTSADE